MDTRKIKSYWFLLLIPFIFGCPLGEERCLDDNDRITWIDDLVIFSPQKDSFKQGEQVIFELTIPDSVLFYENWVSLYQETGDKSPKLITHSELFNNNVLDFKFGYQGSEPNWFHLEYLSEKNLYSLKILVILNEVKEYKIGTWVNETIFKGQDKCNRYRIDTKIKGFERGEFYEFTVIP